MPYMQAYVEKANAALNSNSIKSFNPGVLMPGAVAPNMILSAALQSIGVDITRDATTYLDSWPSGLQEMVRAAVYSAVMQQLPVTFAWMPGYDFKVTATVAPGIPGSIGGMTILLESKYPSPSTGT